VTGSRPTSTSSTTEPGDSSTEPADSVDETRRPPLLEIGRIAKPHGLAGQVVVDLVTNVKNRLEPGTPVSTTAGSVLFVEESRPFGRRWIVNFEGIADRAGAERVRGWGLLAAPVEEPGALWVDELVGASVFDQDGRHLGTVSSLVANPASDLLELEGGGLIPLVFVVERTERRITVDIPAGLLE
jgi:16S rRNA processing protein RimM